MFSRFKKAGETGAAKPDQKMAAVSSANSIPKSSGPAAPKAPAPGLTQARPAPRAPAEAAAADKERKRKDRLQELKVELHKRLLENLNLAALEKASEANLKAEIALISAEALDEMSVALNARKGNRLGTTQLRLGMVGPSAQAEMGQDSLHQWFGRPRFKGWDNQLRDEVVVQLAHERAWRRDFATTAGGWRWDAIGHAGGAVGNLASYANAGAELRFGKHLPDDFGSNPLRLGGDNSAPGTRDENVEAIRWHGFIALDARWVGNDIVFDGNTSKDSHSVDPKDAVADLVLGVAITRGPWKFTATHVRRTREFEGQQELPAFGTLTFSRAF